MSEQRRERLVQEHWDKELQGWKLFRFELERRWSLLYPSFDERDFIKNVEIVDPEAGPTDGFNLPFVKQHFDPKNRGHFEENMVGQADGLVFRARQRLRSKYHFSITAAPPGGYSVAADGPRMQSSRLYLTKDSLRAGMKIASAMDYAVTLSTPMAGASQRTFHFLAMPRELRFGGRPFRLYECLENTEAAEHNRIEGHASVELLLYPALCVRTMGTSQVVSRLVWQLAGEYADLICFNLVLLPGQRIEESIVIFFPRPFNPDWEGPALHAANNEKTSWSFGAFEMGGFFVQGDEEIYKTLTHDALASFVNEVSIVDRAAEKRRLAELLARITSKSVDDCHEQIERTCAKIRQRLR